MSINLLCPIGQTGYGITSYNIWEKLHKKYNDICLFPIGQVNLENHWEKDLIVESIKLQNMFDPNKPCLKIWHQNDLIMKCVGRSKYGVMPFFELDTFSDIEKNHLKCPDIIFCPSNWGKSVLENNGIETPVVVCPLGVDHKIFQCFEPEDKPKDTYVFINVGKWEIRKGHDLLVHIFNKAFTENDNVELWMVNHNQFLNKEAQENWVKMYKSTKLGEKIKIFPRIPTQKSLAKLMAYSDCGIFPARAEGWNNEIMEMMAMNKPVITTNYSAHTEYCTKNNSYLIDIEELELAEDGIWFHGGGNWAKLSDNQIDQAIEHMRYAYTNKIVSNSHGLKDSYNYTWDNTVSIIEKNLLV